jgi:hypothetical protein
MSEGVLGSFRSISCKTISMKILGASALRNYGQRQPLISSEEYSALRYLNHDPTISLVFSLAYCSSGAMIISDFRAIDGQDISVDRISAYSFFLQKQATGWKCACIGAPALTKVRAWAAWPIFCLVEYGCRMLETQIKVFYVFTVTNGHCPTAHVTAA